MSEVPSDSTIRSMPPGEACEYVARRYQGQIDYYWRASRRAKRGYTFTRMASIVFGALVTLVASLSSASFVSGTAWDTPLAILTPVLAAMLAIIGGFSQAFQWGAAWQEMVINATRLERELDRIKVLPAAARDPVAELDRLSALVLEETRGFFDRIIGVGRGHRSAREGGAGSAEEAANANPSAAGTGTASRA